MLLCTMVSYPPPPPPPLSSIIFPPCALFRLVTASAPFAAQFARRILKIAAIYDTRPLAP